MGGQPADAPPVAFEERMSTQVPASCRILRERASASDGGGGASAAVARTVSGADDAGCTAAVMSAVYCAAPQPGLLLAGSLDGTLRVWR